MHRWSIVAVLLGGCSLQLPAGIFACTADSDCPPGQVCVGDRCQMAGTDGGMDGGGPACDPACTGTDVCHNGACIAPDFDGDGDGVAAVVDCDDANPAVGTISMRACSSPCGSGTEMCTAGVWAACSAQPEPCSCEEAATQTIPCGNCGTLTQTCMSNVWVDDPAGCTGSGECAGGIIDMEGGPCGNCGHFQRTCLADCAWDAWACADEGCVPDTMEEESTSCGLCGASQLRTRTCGTATCAWSDWGAWGDCITGPGCTPSATMMATQACGNCGSGTQSRMQTCEDTCLWGPWTAWSTCTGQTGCTPNTSMTRSQNCGNCNLGTQTSSRLCTAACAWGSWGSWGTCSGGGACVPSTMTTQTENCGTSICGTPRERDRSRTCSSSCSWGSWGAWGTCTITEPCCGPDPC